MSQSELCDLLFFIYSFACVCFCSFLNAQKCGINTKPGAVKLVCESCRSPEGGAMETK